MFKDYLLTINFDLLFEHTQNNFNSNNISFVCSVNSIILAYVKLGLIFVISLVLGLNIITVGCL